MPERKDQSSVTYKMIAEALFDNYESIYDIDLATKEYRTYYQSEFYQDLKLAKKGKDFFADLEDGIQRIIAEEDQDYVLRMLTPERLIAGLDKEKYYRLVYKIKSGNQKVYHQLRAAYQQTENGLHILMGIRNIDDLIREQMAHQDTVDAMKQKEHNHLEAVLGSAAAYMGANLSQNIVLEQAAGHRDEKGRQIIDLPSVQEIPVYDDMQKWIAEHLVAENQNGYEKISSREYLTNCFSNGDKRASVSFSVFTQGGDVQPCRAVFHLYKERATGDLHVFCVIYDLTEQQQKEKELKRVERELQMSRLRNFNSQMQPHFLYNALGSIQEVILMDPQYASDLLGDFTVHLRSCVRAMANDKPISFAEELNNIKAYINIEKMRLGEKLDVQYDVETTDFNVLPLTIQPLVENAVRHGVHKRGLAGGCVKLRTAEDDTSRIVQVEDNGVGFDVDRTLKMAHEGKMDAAGILNVRFRLEKVMGGSLEIQSEIGKGTVVTVRLPKEKTR